VDFQRITKNYFPVVCLTCVATYHKGSWRIEVIEALYSFIRTSSVQLLKLSKLVNDCSFRVFWHNVRFIRVIEWVLHINVWASIIWTYQLPDHTQEPMNLDNEGPLYEPKGIIIVWHLIFLLNIQLHILKQCIGGTIKWQMAVKDLTNANL